MTPEVEDLLTRIALKAVLDVERSLGPWDVSVRVHGSENRVTGLFQGRTDVSFTVRGKKYAYRVYLDASDFRSQHLQSLLAASASAVATRNDSHARN